jgi:hypothetical protein
MEFIGDSWILILFVALLFAVLFPGYGLQRVQRIKERGLGYKDHPHKSSTGGNGKNSCGFCH